MDISNMIMGYTDKLITAANENLENILKENVDKGFKYVISKTEIVTVDDITTAKTKYVGIEDIGIHAIKGFEESGYTVYDLDKVRKYMENSGI